MDTDKDNILLERAPGRLGAVNICIGYPGLPPLRDYDVVQLINPHFLSLKPGKDKNASSIFSGKTTGRCFSHSRRFDYYFVKTCLEAKTFPLL